MAILLLLIFPDNKEKRKLLTYPRQSQKGELHLLWYNVLLTTWEARHKASRARHEIRLL